MRAYLTKGKVCEDHSSLPSLSIAFESQVILSSLRKNFRVSYSFHQVLFSYFKGVDEFKQIKQLTLNVLDPSWALSTFEL